MGRKNEKERRICGQQDTSGQNQPIFLGYLEETKYISPHYQSILPTNFYRSNKVLEEIKLGGGFSYEPLSEVFECSSIHNSDTQTLNLPSFIDIQESTRVEKSIIEVTTGNVNEAPNIINVISKRMKRKATDQNYNKRNTKLRSNMLIE